MNNRVKGKVKNRKKVSKLKSSLKVQTRNNSNSTYEVSSKSDSQYKEYDHYNRITVDKLRDNLKYEMKRICKKYRFKNNILRVIVDLNFDLNLHFWIKVNSIIHYHDFYSN